MLISPQGGERRFAAAVAKRYESFVLCVKLCFVVSCCALLVRNFLFSPRTCNKLILYSFFHHCFALTRLESLGALTQGDRSATVGAKNMSITDFNFDTKYGKKVSCQ